MRKHPVIFAFLLLFVIAVTFFFLAFAVGGLSGKRQTFSTSEKVGVVAVDGVIMDAKETVAQLDEFAKDDAIRAVVVRIDSPGGGVAASEEIYNAVRDLRKKKKVVASMGSIAASGGYFVACAAERIVANSGTITGSISAVMHFADAESLMKKVGVRTSVIKSGKFKDIGSPAREMTPEERQLLQSVVDDIYDHLLDVIAKDRRMKKDDLKPLADGRIFTGRQAKKLGLIDDLGDLQYAVSLAGTLAGVQGRPEVVYPAKKKATFWELVFQSAVSSAITELRSRESGMPGLYFITEPAAAVK